MENQNPNDNKHDENMFGCISFFVIAFLIALVAAVIFTPIGKIVGVGMVIGGFIIYVIVKGKERQTGKKHPIRDAYYFTPNQAVFSVLPIDV